MSEREQPSDGPYAPAQQHFLCARVVWRAQVTALPFKPESVSNLLTEVCLGWEGRRFLPPLSTRLLRMPGPEADREHH